jgi:hypothetical protein
LEVTPILALLLDAATATKYADIATMDLFLQDRNPNVIIEPPKVAEPKNMAPLPIIYGVLGLPSGTKGIMSEKDAVFRSPDSRTTKLTAES